MARSSKIDSKQSSDQSSGSATLIRDKDNNPDISNVISNWSSSHQFNVCFICTHTITK